MLYHFLTYIQLSKRIIGNKRTVGGPTSNHDPIILKLQFKQKRKGVPSPKLSKIRVAWDKIDDLEATVELEQEQASMRLTIKNLQKKIDYITTMEER
jgi:hypothetical protein